MAQVGVGRDEAREEAVGGQSVRGCPKSPLWWMCFSGVQAGPQQWKWPSGLGHSKSFRKVLRVFAQGRVGQVQSCGNGPCSLSFFLGRAPPSLLHLDLPSSQKPLPSGHPGPTILS